MQLPGFRDPRPDPRGPWVLPLGTVQFPFARRTSDQGPAPAQFTAPAAVAAPPQSAIDEEEREQTQKVEQSLQRTRRGFFSQINP